MGCLPLASRDNASMIRAASPPPRPPRCRRLPALLVEENSLRPPRQLVYDSPFWLAYLSNMLAMTGVSLLFRYADFVTLLGGTEFHLGWIVGVGMVGSLATRLVLGSCIDRYGTKIVWLASTLLFSATCFTHLAIASHAGVAIYLLRIAFCCTIAGIYGASMTFVSSRTPNERMAELIGMLGTAGFTGTVVGTLLGDFLLGSVTVDPTQVRWMFVAAGSAGLLSFPFAWLSVRNETRPKCHAGPSVVTLLRQHASGTVLVVGVAMGLGLGLPQTFLRTYAAELDIPRIGLFFLVYAGAAIITRVLTRRWPERFGARPIIVLGMAGAALSLALFLLVDAEWQLVVPAVGFGFSHAILFPAVVAVGSVAFPARNRGLATLLVLAAWDLGQVIGAPAVGVLLRYSEFAGLPPYPTMFLAVASLLALVGLWYAARTREAAVAETLE